MKRSSVLNKVLWVISFKKIVSNHRNPKISKSIVITAKTYVINEFLPFVSVGHEISMYQKALLHYTEI